MSLKKALHEKCKGQIRVEMIMTADVYIDKAGNNELQAGGGESLHDTAWDSLFCDKCGKYVMEENGKFLTAHGSLYNK